MSKNTQDINPHFRAVLVNNVRRSIADAEAAFCTAELTRFQTVDANKLLIFLKGYLQALQDTGLIKSHDVMLRIDDYYMLRVDWDIEEFDLESV